MADIFLDQVRTEPRFDFQFLCESDNEFDFVDTDSPYSTISAECEVYEREEFNHKARDFQNTTSYFHINCRSLSSTYSPLRDLICDLAGDNFCFNFTDLLKMFNVTGTLV